MGTSGYHRLPYPPSASLCLVFFITHWVRYPLGTQSDPSLTPLHPFGYYWILSIFFRHFSTFFFQGARKLFSPKNHPPHHPTQPAGPGIKGAERPHILVFNNQF